MDTPLARSNPEPQSIAIVKSHVGFSVTTQNYNRQDLGLARALNRRGHLVKLVLCGDRDEVTTYSSKSSKEIKEYTFRSRQLGTHGILPRRAYDMLRVDTIIHYADIQVGVPAMKSFSDRARIAYFPYIGTLRTSRQRASAMGRIILAKNLSVYRESHCLAKTPHIEQELRGLGVRSVSQLSVGLDPENLRPTSECTREAAREELGLPPSGPVVLSIGRLEAYRNPLALPRLFARIREECPATLLVVGEGSLEQELSRLLRVADLDVYTKRVSYLPQPEIWKAFRAANVTVNLNPGEIVGMSILESLYYATPVVAVRAPGPSNIISNGVDGFTVEPSDEGAFAERVISILTNRNTLPGGSKNLTWDDSLTAANLPF